MKQKKSFTLMLFGVLFLGLMMTNKSYAQSLTPVTANHGVMTGDPKNPIVNSVPQKIENGNLLDVQTGAVTTTVVDANQNLTTIVYTYPSVDMNAPVDISETQFISHLQKWMDMNPNYKNYCTSDDLMYIESGDFHAMFKAKYVAAKNIALKNQSK